MSPLPRYYSYLIRRRVTVKTLVPRQILTLSRFRSRGDGISPCLCRQRSACRGTECSLSGCIYRRASSGWHRLCAASECRCPRRMSARKPRGVARRSGHRKRWVWLRGGGRNAGKIPQVGIVELEDDVEIGANTTVDRATLGRTLIGRGVKIDNLVQIAHNVVVGENSIIAAQAGIAGSTRIGKDVMLGGRVWNHQSSDYGGWRGIRTGVGYSPIGSAWGHAVERSPCRASSENGLRSSRCCRNYRDYGALCEIWRRRCLS